MYSQTRYQQEDYYDDQGGYESQKGCYNSQYFDPYSYGGCRSWKQPSQEQYQPIRPPPRTYEEYDDPPESYQESYDDHDCEHSRRVQPLRRDTSYDHSREYQTPRYYRDDYGEDYHDQEDYYYERRMDRRSASHQSYESHFYPSSHYYDEDDHYLPQRESTKSQFYDSHPSQAYSPKPYTQNTPPPKKKANAEPQGKYGLSEETWALAKRLGINIIAEDDMEEYIRVTPRVEQGELDHRPHVSLNVPLEDVIEDTKESELEIPIGEEVQDQVKESQNGECRKEFEEKKDEEVEAMVDIEEPHGSALESPYGKNLHSSCGKTILANNHIKSWADMCEEDDCDDMGVPNCVDKCDIENVENSFVEPSCDNDSLTLVDNSLISTHDSDMFDAIGVPILVDNSNVECVGTSIENMCEEEDDMFDDGVPIVVDSANIACLDASIENNFVENSNVDCLDASIENILVDSSKIDCLDTCIENILVDDSNIDCLDTCIENILVDNSNVDCVGACLDNIVVDKSCEMMNDVEDAQLETLEEGECANDVDMHIDDIDKIEEVIEEHMPIEENNCKIYEEDEVKKNEKEETREEKVINDEGELKEEKKDKEKKKMEGNRILSDVDSCQSLERSMLWVGLNEFLDARHLRAYLEEKVDGEKGLAPVQVCLSDGSKVASG